MILVTRHPISIGGHKLRRLSGSPGGGTAMVPGCLTGESEERETWTAESLRAASSNGDLSSDRSARRAAADETSAVHVSGQHHFRAGSGRSRGENRAAEHACTENRWDLVKRDVTSRDQISSNLRV